MNLPSNPTRVGVDIDYTAEVHPKLIALDGPISDTRDVDHPASAEGSSCVKQRVFFVAAGRVDSASCSDRLCRRLVSKGDQPGLIPRTLEESRPKEFFGDKQTIFSRAGPRHLCHGQRYEVLDIRERRATNETDESLLNKGPRP